MRIHLCSAVRLLSVGLVLAVCACQKGGPPPAMPEGESASTNGSSQKALTAIPETEEACKSCNGVWGVHGLADVEGCLCRTKDAGKTCRDGGECEGACLASEDGFEVVDKGPPEKGFYRGTCSEFTVAFGCHLFVPTGARKKGPREKEDAADSLCVD